MSQPRLLAFAGSARKESFNRRLVAVAAAQAQSAGAVVTLINLHDFPLPIMDEDVEAASGLPAHARALKDLFLSHHGLLIACPEYNSSITPMLKNVIDWVSRPVPGEAPLGCFNGKVAALLSASPGALGGLRGLVHVRAILSSINVTVLPDQFALGKAHEAFNAEGALKDNANLDRIRAVVARLVHVTGRLVG
ncbi:MAG: NAD(P)H-dependent oxidoreductase [Phycisphaeraceae bacterium]|nr:NAD(P)H-dependent oxidoreductase [Phycisphaeraceae bacterium]